MKLPLWAASIAAALSLCAQADAAVLTFDGDICGGACFNNASIDSTYGDIAGQVDVQYNHDITGVSPGNQLQWWDTAYSDLTNVAWGSINDAVGTPEIFLKPLNGLAVTLNSFDIGSWPNTSRNTQVTIVDGLGNVLFSSGAITIDAFAHTHFTPGFTSANGLGIQWGPSGFNVGIDNVSFSLDGVAPVPEPATWAMMLAGFFMLGGMLRLSKQRERAVGA